ncbi:MAG TPA: orotate phosphoribosyltransferase [Desulfohalobiaceae bacterium]|nr:orotate phosphoribosyltransferase [Desulfohalobiaceae bacterium]
MEPGKAKLANLLLEKSYFEGEFTLTSGRKSHYYFDCKPTALDPAGAYWIGRTLFDHLHPQVQGIGGMTLGADPLVSSVCLVSYLQDRGLPGFIVRKTPKSHGTQQYLEGLINFQAGQKVALLEDVVTTGGSVLKACQRVLDVGLQVVQILCVLDREEGGGQNLLDHGYQLESLFTRQALQQYQKNAGKT